MKSTAVQGIKFAQSHVVNNILIRWRWRHLLFRTGKITSLRSNKEIMNFFLLTQMNLFRKEIIKLFAATKMKYCLKGNFSIYVLCEALESW